MDLCKNLKQIKEIQEKITQVKGAIYHLETLTEIKNQFPKMENLIKDTEAKIDQIKSIIAVLKYLGKNNSQNTFEIEDQQRILAYEMSKLENMVKFEIKDVI